MQFSRAQKQQAANVLESILSGDDFFKGHPRLEKTGADFLERYGINLNQAPTVFTKAGMFWRLVYLYDETTTFDKGAKTVISEQAYYAPVIAQDGRLEQRIYDSLYRGDIYVPLKYLSQWN